MKTEWDWDYFYSMNMKGWESCKKRKEKRDWINKHLALAVEYILDRIREDNQSDVEVSGKFDEVKKAIRDVIDSSTWQFHRLFIWRLKSKIRSNIQSCFREIEKDWRISSKVKVKYTRDLPDIISTKIVEGLKEWTSIFIWMSKPEDIIAWEFGREKEKKNKKVKVENPSILWRIKKSVREQIEAYKSDIYINAMMIHDTCMLLDQSIGYFLESRVPVSKIRMFRPSVDELRKYLEESVGKGRGTFLIGMYCKAYDDEMPKLCGIFGEYGILSAEKRRAYIRSRKIDNFIQRVFKKLDTLPVNIEEYSKLIAAMKSEEVADIKIEGDINTDKEVCEEIRTLINNVIRPILRHLALTAVRREELRISSPYWHNGLPKWDNIYYEYHDHEADTFFVSQGATNADVLNQYRDLKNFMIKMYNSDKKEMRGCLIDSFDVYNAIYRWYWKKGKEMFDSEVIKSKLWEKKGK